MKCVPSTKYRPSISTAVDIFLCVKENKEHKLNTDRLMNDDDDSNYCVIARLVRCVMCFGSLDAPRSMGAYKVYASLL